MTIQAEGLQQMERRFNCSGCGAEMILVYFKPSVSELRDFIFYPLTCDKCRKRVSIPVSQVRARSSEDMFNRLAAQRLNELTAVEVQSDNDNA